MFIQNLNFLRNALINIKIQIARYGEWSHTDPWIIMDSIHPISLVLLQSKARTPNKTSLKLAVMFSRFLDKLTCLFLYQKQRKRRPLNYTSDVIILEKSVLTYSHQMVFIMFLSLFLPGDSGDDW